MPERIPDNWIEGFEEEAGSAWRIAQEQDKAAARSKQMSSEDVTREKGQIKDPELAEQMARIEDHHRRRFLGIFPASKKKVEEGMRAAESHAEDGKTISRSELPGEARTAFERACNEMSLRPEGYRVRENKDGNIVYSMRYHYYYDNVLGKEYKPPKISTHSTSLMISPGGKVLNLNTKKPADVSKEPLMAILF